MDRLQIIVNSICQEFEAKHAARELVLQQSRDIIRQCANAIRATHRDEFDEVARLLAAARAVAAAMRQAVGAYPDLYYAGYTQDALKELSEAHITYALVTGGEVPSPGDLQVEASAYLNGLAEAVGELRRYVLDRLRRGDVATGERLLAAMDDIYALLTTVDYPDAITGGLRRNTDMVRGVLERTRGDLTTATRQEEMKRALLVFSQRIGLAAEETPSSYLAEGDEV